MSAASDPTRSALLSVRDLSLEFRTRTGTVRALDKVSLEVAKGETVGIVGESGSGKSVLSFSVLGILDDAAKVTGGSIRFGGDELLGAGERKLRRLRGREIAMIFQNPRTALNPIRAIGPQIEDVLAEHEQGTRADFRRKALEGLAQVRIPDPERRYSAYPFELSGGQCQRVMIALALACGPQLLIADEPTTGLDVTTQAAIMALVRDLSSHRNMATVLITHDLALASEYCDRIVVMHAGQIAEVAGTRELFESPRHPYTAKLIASTPSPEGDVNALSSVAGNLPDMRSERLPKCRFYARCERALERCAVEDLPEVPVAPGHSAFCFNPLPSASVRKPGA
jgi:peptide/nickel transport system ATP-binding protein